MMKAGVVVSATALVVVVLASSSAGCTSTSCTMMGCEGAVSAKLTVDRPLSELLGASVVACRNGLCEEGVLERTTSDRVVCNFPTRTGGRGPSCSSRTNLAVVASKGTSDPGPVEVDFQFAVNEGEERDGDTFAFRVIDKASQPAGQIEGAVTYQVSQPNGAECAPTCRSATVN